MFDRPKLSVKLLFNEDDIALRSSSEVQVKPEVHGWSTWKYNFLTRVVYEKFSFIAKVSPGLFESLTNHVSITPYLFIQRHYINNSHLPSCFHKNRAFEIARQGALTIKDKLASYKPNWQRMHSLQCNNYYTQFRYLVTLKTIHLKFFESDHNYRCFEDLEWWQQQHNQRNKQQAHKWRWHCFLACLLQHNTGITLLKS